jgi:hypothetical protein
MIQSESTAACGLPARRLYLGGEAGRLKPTAFHAYFSDLRTLFAQNDTVCTGHMIVHGTKDGRTCTVHLLLVVAASRHFACLLSHPMHAYRCSNSTTPRLGPPQQSGGPGGC